MDTPLVPVKSRSIRLSYPCAVIATALIVGGAPPASPGADGLRGATPALTCRRTGRRARHPDVARLGHAAECRARGAHSVCNRADPASTAPVVAPVAVSVERAAARRTAFGSAPRLEGRRVPARGLAIGAVGKEERRARWARSSTMWRAVQSWAVWRPTRPENPASNQKILTTAAVLRHFGAEFRFRTVLCGARAGDAIARLVLRGKRRSVGSGSEDLQELAKTLAQSGVRHVGELLVDQSYFDAHFVPPAFEQQPQEWAAFRAPVSAVSLNRNVTTLNVVPTEPGQPARVWFDPEGFVDVSGTVRTDALRDSPKG